MTGKSTKKILKWKLRAVLQREKISVYALTNAMGGETRRSTITAHAAKDPAFRPKSISYSVLSAMLEALEKLTGKTWAVSDLLEWS